MYTTGQQGAGIYYQDSKEIYTTLGGGYTPPEPPPSVYLSVFSRMLVDSAAPIDDRERVSWAQRGELAWVRGENRNEAKSCYC